jgi:hypothetical protein
MHVASLLSEVGIGAATLISVLHGIDTQRQGTGASQISFLALSLASTFISFITNLVGISAIAEWVRRMVASAHSSRVVPAYNQADDMAADAAADATVLPRNRHRRRSSIATIASRPGSAWSTMWGWSDGLKRSFGGRRQQSKVFDTRLQESVQQRQDSTAAQQ